MNAPDPVQAYLAARGAPANLVDEGIPGLVRRWEVFVAGVGEGYALTLDDYLNDLDLRTLLDGALAVAPDAVRDEAAGRLAAADDALRLVTVPSPCLWGHEVAEEMSDLGHWWYFRRPASPSEELRDELEAWGLLGS
jgi:hypothetical protein